MQSDIRREVDSNAETGFTYTHVLNGFSIEAYAEDIERIKALPNVENVYISQYRMAGQRDVYRQRL